MNVIPKDIRRIYLLGVCGTGMGALAGLLQERGFEIKGSDQNVYPPMSTELERQGIQVASPYSADTVRRFAPDMVIVGNTLSRGNPEIEHVLTAEIPYVSMPQALNHFFLQDSEVIVVAGTHGKTTTTSLLAFLLDKLGQYPSYLIGGVDLNFASGFHIGNGRLFVIEGDEYDTAFFDKGPKFLHYNPTHVIMTSLEFDHADIYRDLDHMTEAFVKLARIIPPSGSLHYADDYPRLQEAAELCPALKHRYGFVGAAFEIRDYTGTPEGSRFTLYTDGEPAVEIVSPLTGRHNAMNVTACFSVLRSLNLELGKAADALHSYRGIKRRQEILFDDGKLAVIDDFAHHPKAVAETIRAVRERFPGRRLTAVFEPRSNTSMRDVFQNEFIASFLDADEILLAPVFNPAKIPEGRRLDVEALTAGLNARCKRAFNFRNTADIIAHIVGKTFKPAVALIMSNGAFDNIHARLITAWKKA